MNQDIERLDNNIHKIKKIISSNNDLTEQQLKNFYEYIAKLESLKQMILMQITQDPDVYANT